MERAKSLVAALGRLGYMARALVYVTIGTLAIQAVILSGQGKLTDSKGALRAMTDLPGGTVLLIVLAIGLLGYSLWRLVQSIGDADHHGNDFKGLAVRGGLFISAITHGALAYYTYKLFSGNSSQGSGGKQSQLAYLMSFDYGKFLVMTVGLVLVGFGGAQLVKAFKETYMKYMQIPHNKYFFSWIAKIGLTSRALVFAVLGGFCFYAGYTYDPNQAGGLEKMWSFLAEQSSGLPLVFLMGLGLLLFGVYSGFEAVYRKVSHT